MRLSFVAMPRGAFTGFQMIFLFRCPFVPEAERMQSVLACPMNETGGHTQPDKPGRMIVATRLGKFRRIGNNHTSFVMVCPFHASGGVFFFQTVFLFTDFPLKFFLPNLPLFSFTSILRLSVSRISQSFSFWAQR